MNLLTKKFMASLSLIHISARMVGTSIIAGLVVTSVKIELAAFPFQEMADVIFPGGEAVIPVSYTHLVYVDKRLVGKISLSTSLPE